MKKRISLDFLSVLLALAAIAVFVLLVILTGRKDGKTDPSITFTEHEISLIRSADSLMRVLTVSDSADLAVLRGKSSALSGADMSSPGSPPLRSVYRKGSWQCSASTRKGNPLRSIPISA